MPAAINAFDGCRGAGSGAMRRGTCSGSASRATVVSAGSATGGATSGVMSRIGIASTCAGSSTTSAVARRSGAGVAAGSEAPSACAAFASVGRVPHFLQNFAPAISSAPQPLQPNAATGAAWTFTGVPHDLQKRAPAGVLTPQFVQLVIPFRWQFIGISPGVRFLLADIVFSLGLSREMVTARAIRNSLLNREAGRGRLNLSPASNARLAGL